MVLNLLGGGTLLGAIVTATSIADWSHQSSSALSSSSLSHTARSAGVLRSNAQSPVNTITGPKIRYQSLVERMQYSGEVVVGGQVHNPSPFMIARPITLEKGIALAGGATEFGALNRIRVFRQAETQDLDMNNAEHQNFLLQPNDVVEVPQKRFIGR